MVYLARSLSILFGFLLLGEAAFWSLISGVLFRQEAFSLGAFLLVFGTGMVLACPFLYAGLFAQRMAASGIDRAFGAMLLALPVGFGTLLLAMPAGLAAMLPADAMPSDLDVLGWELVVMGVLACGCLVWPRLPTPSVRIAPP